MPARVFRPGWRLGAEIGSASAAARYAVAGRRAFPMSWRDLLDRLKNDPSRMLDYIAVFAVVGSTLFLLGLVLYVVIVY